ncbi:MAG: helix-turn-helix domain-containing protein [Gallionella sp.]
MLSIQNTVGEWALKLGRQIRSIRLKLNYEQATLAEIAGVSIKAITNLETGKGATIKTLIKVLRAVNRVEWLETLAPPLSVSPLQLLRTRKTKERASSPRKAKNV